MGGQSGGGSTTVQKADPWSGVQPYLQQLYSGAGSLAAQGGPQVAQNSGVAPFTPYTQSIMDRINSYGAGADPNQQAQALLAGQMSDPNGTQSNSTYRNLMSGVVDGQHTLAAAANGADTTSNYYRNVLNNNDPTAQYFQSTMQGLDPSSQYLSKVMNGGYLNGNPGLTAAMDAANSNTTRQFQTAVMPQLASQFSLAGRYGSGAQSQGVSDATNNLATQLSNTNAGIMNANYQNERNLQNGAAGTLAGIQGGAANNLTSLRSAAAGNLGSYMTNAAGNYINSQTTGAQGLQGNMLSGMQGLQQAYANNGSNLNVLGTLSDAQQQQAQAILSGNNALYDANQQRPYANESWLNGILNGSMSLNGQNSSTTGNSSAFQRLGGGALSGGLLGGAIAGASGGSIGGPVGMGVGALGGALLSVL